MVLVAGHSQRRNPYDYIVTEDGFTLRELASRLPPEDDSEQSAAPRRIVIGRGRGRGGGIMFSGGRGRGKEEEDEDWMHGPQVCVSWRKAVCLCVCVSVCV